MKKIGLLLFAFLAMSVVALAQQNEGRRGMRRGNAPRMNKEQMVENMTKRQVERLKLTEEQTAQMKVINEALVTEMMGDRPQSADSVAKNRVLTREEREARRKEREARMEEMRNNYVTLAKAILTPEQFVEFEKMQKERPQGRRPEGRRGQGNRGQGPRGGGFGGGQDGFGENR